MLRSISDGSSEARYPSSSTFVVPSGRAFSTAGSVGQPPYFGYDQTMNVDDSNADVCVSAVAAAIAEPARTRMLYCLMDGRSRTATELAIVADVSASTASAHLAKLRKQRLVRVLAQGKHRYYNLENASVAAALEALLVISEVPRDRFEPSTPHHLRYARTCYDHMAGTLAVALHDSFVRHKWLSSCPSVEGDYNLSAAGALMLPAMGIDAEELRSLRRRFACTCLDWSERRPHIGGALGAALLHTALKRRWVVKDLDSRALRLTKTGGSEIRARFDIGEWNAR